MLIYIKKKKLWVQSIQTTFLHEESVGTWSGQIHTTAEHFDQTRKIPFEKTVKL
jgi:hypothetical protein